MPRKTVLLPFLFLLFTGCATLPPPETTPPDAILADWIEDGPALEAAGESPLERAQASLVKAYHGGSLSRGEVKNCRAQSKAKHAPNIWAVGAACLAHAGEVDLSEISGLWLKSNRELGGFYEMWHFSAVASLLKLDPDHPGIVRYARGILAAHYLAQTPVVVNKIATTSHRGRFVRDVSANHLAQSGSISMLPGQRMRWKPDKEFVGRELSILPAYARTAAGEAPRWRSLHRLSAWAHEISRAHVPRFEGSIIGHLDALPLGSGRRVHFIRTDVARAWIVEDTHRQTRGPTVLTVWHAGSRTLETYSPSTQIPGGAGTWYGAKTVLDGLRWTSRTPKQEISGVIQGGRIISHLVWDGTGAREVVGPGSPPPGPPAGDPIADPGLIGAAMVLVDQAAREVEAAGGVRRGAEMRRQAELLRRAALEPLL